MRILIILLFLVNTAYALEGRVHTSDGIGVESATVILKFNNEEHKIISGERGTFNFFNLGNNIDFEIIVSKSGHGSNNIFGNTSESQSIGIELNPEIFTLSGKVITESGESINEVEVTLEGIETKITGEDGTFSFNVPYGLKYKITLNKGDDEYFFFNSPEGTIFGNTERIIIGEFE